MRDVVLVTGSSRGIGKACAVEFAKKGYDVIINYVKQEQEAIAFKKMLEETYSIQALLVKADISKEEEVKNMVEEIIQHFGHIDCLVNNAGIALDTTFSDKTVENFQKILNTNLIGTFLVSKYVGIYMQKEKKGTIVNISSTNGIDTIYPESLDYDASKAGVISLTKNLAIQYAPYIRVNSVAPGWVLTEMNQNLDDDFIQKEKQKILLKKFANPEEIAKVVVFLASNDASYINGEVIRVDGGFRA